MPDTPKVRGGEEWRHAPSAHRGAELAARSGESHSARHGAEPERTRRVGHRQPIMSHEQEQRLLGSGELLSERPLRRSEQTVTWVPCTRSRAISSFHERHATFACS